MDVRPVQPSNAHSPIDVTEFGISMDERPVQPKNAYFPIFETEFGIIRSDIFFPSMYNSWV